MSRRGVSETLGFVLVFAIVTSTIGVVYATGFSGLYEVQQAEKLENMERAFDVLADNVGDLVRRGAPSRATEVKLSGGSLAFGEQTTITVNATNTSNTSDHQEFTVSPSPLVYSQGDTEIVYNAGAVFRTDAGKSFMLSGPGWILSSDRVAVTFVKTAEGSDSSSIGGESTILVITKLNYAKLHGSFETNTSDPIRVNITVESSRAGAWADYFDREGLDAIDSDPSDDTVTYQIETDVVYVPKTKVVITISP